MESALLVYHFAFVELGFEQSHFDVRKNNEKVIEFHKKMGAIEVSNNELDIFFKSKNLIIICHPKNLL
ncbi:hypothetical protein ACUOFC_65445, partial [Escherichia sp. TWPC-MK]